MNKQKEFSDRKYKKFVKEIEKFNRLKAVELLEKQLKDGMQYPIQERVKRENQIG